MFRKPWSGPYAYLALGVLVGAVVLLFTWDFASILTEQRVRGEKTAEYHQSLAEQNIENECLGLKSPALRDCIHEAIETARDHERSEQDLDAQQQMAVFTRVMGYTAIVGLVLGGVSIYLIYMTLRATQNMVTETRAIGEAQTRAYVTGDEPRIVERESTPELMVATQVWRNSGNSPALNFGYVGYTQFRQPDDPPSTFSILHEELETVNFNTLGSGDSAPAGKYTIPLARTLEQAQGRVMILVASRITYEDVFGTRWCYCEHLFPQFLATGAQVQVAGAEREGRLFRFDEATKAYEPYKG